MDTAASSADASATGAPSIAAAADAPDETLPSTILEIRGGHIRDSATFTYDAAAATSKKVLPPGVCHTLVLGWGEPGVGKPLEFLDESKNKWKPAAPTLEALLTSRSCFEEFTEMMAKCKAQKGSLSLESVSALLFDAEVKKEEAAEAAAITSYRAKFEAKGIRLFLCKTSVNPGFDPQRTFVWIEFSARPGYEPAEQYVAPPKEGSNAQCVIM